jgi:predicted Kef-type K+ transport protein
VLAFAIRWATALTISASLAQIGEFSFILAASASNWPAAGRAAI